MAEVQPPVEGQVNGGAGGGGTLVGTLAETVPGPTKRQRRPSVRLGEIGDQLTYDNHRRTKQQQWRYSSKEAKTSKTRQLMNLSAMEYQETLDGGGEDKDGGGNKSNHNIGNNNTNNPLDCVALGSWKVRDSSKSKRGFSTTTTKRVRSNWGVSKMDEGDEKFEEEDDFDDVDRYTDYDREGSGSQLKEPSLNLSMDNDRDLHYGTRSREGTRVRVSDGIELDGPSDTDARNWNTTTNNNNPERNGVRVWLNQLGLGRYAPIFEVHEVDDEVLPLLTLEDLKDMGINAVGSRRKMFCSIQKLGKGFS